MADVMAEAPLFADREEAGRLLAHVLAPELEPGTVVVGLARGGVVVAAEVAHALGLPLDVVAVRKVGHPWQPEYALGAVTPGGGVYVRDDGGITPGEVICAIASAQARAVELDRILHERTPPADLAGRACVVVDGGIATGATMVAALRWARASGAARAVAAAPVGAPQTLPLLAAEADAVVCPYAPDPLLAVGLWYVRFAPVEDAEVVALLAAAAREQGAAA